MFRFQHIEFIYLLLLIPIVVFIFYFFYKKRKKQWSQVNSKKTLERFTFGKLSVPKWKIILPILALLLSVIAILNPQWSNQKVRVQIESSDVFIALDISRSMLANDILPSRLERAKLLATDIIKRLEGNRIGLILFAGEAYMHMPLTTDIGATISFLESANPNQAPTQGTAIASSIQLAMQSFSKDREVGKSIIILSDGEDHEAELEEQLDEAKDQNIGIFTIAVGTETGGYLPGEQLDNYLFDESGQVVKSVVNTEMLRDIAQSTNANFFNLSKESNIDKAILNNINQLEKHLTEDMLGTKYKSYFQFFLFPVILWLLFTMFRTLKSSSTRSQKMVTIIVFLLSCAVSQAQYGDSNWYEGNNYYELEKYDLAIQSYNASLEKELRFETLFNLGNALYNIDSIESASKAYRMALNHTDNDEYKSKAHYNLGNILLDVDNPNKENIEKAILEYKMALRHNLENIKAQGNLYIAQTVLNLLEEQEKKQKKQQQNQEDQQENEQNQEKNQDQQEKDQQKKDGDQKEQKEQGEQNQNDQQENDQDEAKEQKNQSSEDGKMTKRKVSKQEIENILRMVAEQDKNIQGKLRKTQKSNNTTKSKKKW